MTLHNWQKTEPVLLAFESEWQRGNAPDFAAFVGALPDELRDELLPELVMIDMEHRRRLSPEVNADDYIRQWPALHQSIQIREELLQHEFLLRLKSGTLPQDTELSERYPDDTSVVALRDSVAESCLPKSDRQEDLAPGTVISHYRIEQCIGRGAFSTVHSAVDLKLNRRVALKVLNSDSALRPELRTRLLREAQALATLQHPNIVSVYETTQEENRDCIVSQLVTGITLQSRLDEGGVSTKEAVAIGRDLADALEHVHRAGIIHRDIKPSNIMIQNGVPLLLDFGLAHLNDASLQLTVEGDFVGTPAFMSPEQADGRGWQADPRSDVYSLGAVLYTMVFNRLPFAGSTQDVIARVLQEEAAIPRTGSVQIHRDLQTVILKCLQKDPADRYSSAAALAADLNAFLDGRPVRARPPGVLGTAGKFIRRRPAMSGLIAGIVILAAFLGGIGTQLFRVAEQRDRANSAEQQATALLADSSALAGRLAMQRGQMPLAIEHFQRSLDSGNPHRAEMLLRQVEAHFAMRHLESTAALLREAMSEATRESDLAEIELWKAELALEGFLEFGDALQLVDHCRNGLLTEADSFYAEALAAESSPAAVQFLNDALNADPFHHRARRSQILLLLSLARVEEAATSLRTARQLFPDDPDFILLECLSLAAREDTDAASRILTESDLSDELRQQCLTACRFIDDLDYENPVESYFGDPNLMRLRLLEARFRDEVLPLLESRRWRFPPRIGQRLAEFFANLPILLSDDDDVRASAIHDLIATHPEGTLAFIRAIVLLKRVNTAAPDHEAQIERLLETRLAFQQALRLPAFVRDSEESCWKSIWGTSALLALNYQQDSEQSLELMRQASRQISTQSVDQPSAVRGFAIAALSSRDEEEADRWIPWWVEIAGDDQAQLCDALWHEGIRLQRRQDWLRVEAVSRRLKSLNPEYPGVDGMLTGALNEIRNRLLDAAAEDPTDGS